MRFQTDSAKLPAKNPEKTSQDCSGFHAQVTLYVPTSELLISAFGGFHPILNEKKALRPHLTFPWGEFCYQPTYIPIPETLRFEMFKNLGCVLIWLAFTSDPSSSMHISPGPTNSSFHVVNNVSKVGGPRSPASMEWSLQEPEDLTAVQRALLGMPLVPWDGEDGENQQEIGENPAGSWLVSSFFAMPFEVSKKKRSEVNQPWGWKKIMPENPAKQKSSGLERLGFLQFVYRHVVIFHAGDQGFVSSERCNFQVCVPQTLPSWGTGRISQVICWLRVVDQNSLCKSEIVVGRCFFWRIRVWFRFLVVRCFFATIKIRNNDEKTPPEKNHRHRFPEKVHWKEHPNILFQNHTPRKLTTSPPKKVTIFSKELSSSKHQIFEGIRHSSFLGVLFFFPPRKLPWKAVKSTIFNRKYIFDSFMVDVRFDVTVAPLGLTVWISQCHFSSLKRNSCRLGQTRILGLFNTTIFPFFFTPTYLGKISILTKNGLKPPTRGLLTTIFFLIGVLGPDLLGGRQGSGPFRFPIFRVFFPAGLSKRVFFVKPQKPDCD